MDIKDWLLKLETKFDRQDERVDHIDVNIAEIKESLKEHMRRTLANEENNKLLRELIDEDMNEVDSRFEPIEKMKNNIILIGWIIGILVGCFEFLKTMGLL